MSANSTAKRDENRPAQVSTKESANRPAGSASFVSESGVPKVAETMRVEIERLDHLMNLAGELVINKSRFVQIAGGMHDLFRSKDSLFAAKDFADHLDSLSRQLVVGAGQSRSSNSSEHLSDVIQRLREDYRAVEGEIEKLHHARRQFDAMTEAIHQLTRVAEGIQKSVMDTRMAPVEPLFTRFKRVVRDVAQGAGKEVTLVISGEKTELDKRMIDELGDPLIHMVRNAVDHGLETPAEREAVGKPRAGTVRLEAMHRGNSVMILVSDDGRGIDSTRVLKKAIENGLVSESDSLLLTERQILNFIWHPGLSTAAKITDISGRGVGMDIVKSKIDELNGSVDVRTEPGAGSTFTIRLPLTMAILPSLLVRIYDEVYAMPLENVEEIVNVSVAEIYSVRGKRTIKVRDGVLTLIQLDDIFRWSGGGHPNAGSEMTPSDSKKQDLTVVILVSSETRIGLVVDHLIGEDDIVIKSLTENFVNIRGLSGASILGDGRVSLILDVSTLVDMVVHPDAARLSA